jgi:hypothetical protein
MGGEGGGGCHLHGRQDKQWTHISSQLRMLANNTILSPVTPISDNDGVNSGMGGESRSVSNALLILKTGKNMGDYHQDMDYAFYVLLEQTSDSLLTTWERILLMTILRAHKVSSSLLGLSLP